MFEAIQDALRKVAEGFQERYNSLSNSVDKLNQDISEIRDTFVTVKNVVVSVFSFLGQETAILLFCTFLFLFVINMIPFFFLSKRIRYGIGVCFGVYLSFSFGYTLWSLAKYILIMFLPMIVEYLLMLFLRKTGKSLWSVIKKGLGFIWHMSVGQCRRLFSKPKKNEEDEKQGSQTPKNL